MDILAAEGAWRTKTTIPIENTMTGKAGRSTGHRTACNARGSRPASQKGKLTVSRGLTGRDLSNQRINLIVE